MLTKEICSKARLSRDARFDGKFFTAVKTTKIYCRSICPANAPKEQNVEYYSSAIAAAKDGFRPCLRCRPDSAPDSPAWNGSDAILNRSIKLINQGALENHSLKDFAEYLGISDRYLRLLFVKNLGLPPKKYALYQQCLFAKQLLHQTSLSISQIALASGFTSQRRFNDCFKKQLNLTPSQIRKSLESNSNSINIKLYYRPPYNWKHMHGFYQDRLISDIEWINKNSYGRTFNWNACKGHFTATHNEKENRFDVAIDIDDITKLKPIIRNIRRILDLDADIMLIEKNLKENFSNYIDIRTGLRLPGIWSLFEAGIRAILGQQISVTAAKNLVVTLVKNLGIEHNNKRLFPSPTSIANSKLAFLKIPNSRKQTLINLAKHFIADENSNDPDTWLPLKGIGPWTVSYAKLRGLSDPDVFLGGDLGIKKIMESTHSNINFESATPWRSYLTFQMWGQH